MSRTQIYLEKSQHDALRREAIRQRRTVSEIIRGIIRERFAAQKRIAHPAHKPETLIEAAERIGKLAEKGPKDLAKNMDKYLYGDI